MLPLGYEMNFRYNELLKEAEQYRLARRVAAGQPRVQARVLQNLGSLLIALGQNLKTISLSL